MLRRSFVSSATTRRVLLPNASAISSPTTQPAVTTTVSAVLSLTAMPASSSWDSAPIPQRYIEEQEQRREAELRARADRGGRGGGRGGFGDRGGGRGGSFRGRGRGGGDGRGGGGSSWRGGGGGGGRGGGRDFAFRGGRGGGRGRGGGAGDASSAITAGGGGGGDVATGGSSRPNYAPMTFLERYLHLPFHRLIVELKRYHRINPKSAPARRDAIAVMETCVPADVATAALLSSSQEGQEQQGQQEPNHQPSPSQKKMWLSEESAVLYLSAVSLFDLHDLPQTEYIGQWVRKNIASFSDPYYLSAGAIALIKRMHGDPEVMELVRIKVMPRVLELLPTCALGVFDQAVRLVSLCTPSKHSAAFTPRDAARWKEIADRVSERSEQIGSSTGIIVSCVAALVRFVPEHPVVKEMMDTLFNRLGDMRHSELARFAGIVEMYGRASFAQVKEIIGRFSDHSSFSSAFELSTSLPCLARTALQTVDLDGVSELSPQEVSDVRDLMQMVLDENELKVLMFMDPPQQQELSSSSFSSSQSSSVKDESSSSSQSQTQTQTQTQPSSSSPSSNNNDNNPPPTTFRRERYCKHVEDMARIMFAYESFGRVRSVGEAAASSSSPASAIFKTYANYIEREFSSMTPHCIALTLGILSRTNTLTSAMACRCADFLVSNCFDKDGHHSPGFFFNLEEAGFCALALSQFPECGATVKLLQQHILEYWSRAVSSDESENTMIVTSSSPSSNDNTNTTSPSSTKERQRRIKIIGNSDHAVVNAAVTTAITLSSSKDAEKLLLGQNINNNNNLVKSMRTFQLVQMWNSCSTCSTQSNNNNNNNNNNNTNDFVKTALLTELKSRLVSRGVKFGAVELSMLCATSGRNPDIARELQACINAFLNLSTWSCVAVDLLKYSNKLDKAPYAAKALQTATALAVSGAQFVHFYETLTTIFPTVPDVRAFGTRGVLQLARRNRYMTVRYIERCRANKQLKPDEAFATDVLQHVLPKTHRFAGVANIIAMLAEYYPAIVKTDEQRTVIINAAVVALKQFVSSSGALDSSAFSANELFLAMLRGSAILVGAEHQPKLKAAVAPFAEDAGKKAGAMASAAAAPAQQTVVVPTLLVKPTPAANNKVTSPETSIKKSSSSGSSSASTKKTSSRPPPPPPPSPSMKQSAKKTQQSKKLVIKKKPAASSPPKKVVTKTNKSAKKDNSKKKKKK